MEELVNQAHWEKVICNGVGECVGGLWERIESSHIGCGHPNAIECGFVWTRQC